MEVASTATSQATGPHEAPPGDDPASEGGRPPEGRLRSSRSGRNLLIEWVVIIVVALVASLLVKTFAVQAFYIPSQSMEPTIQPWDRVLVDKLADDFGAVGTGDIIVFVALQRTPRRSTTS